MLKKLLVTLLLMFLLAPAVYAGDISVYINDNKIQFSPAPQIKNGTTIVPMRSFFEALGAKVLWEEETRTVTGIRGDTWVILQVDSSLVVVNGEQKILAEPARIINDRLFIPLRFVGEALGENVGWEPISRTVFISSGKPVNIEIVNQGTNFGNSGNPKVQGQGTNDQADGGVHLYETQVIELVNKERAKYGLASLKGNVNLSKVARVKSEDMRDAQYFSHDSPNYGSPFEMMKLFNISYGTAGENLAAGQSSPEQVVASWMDSQGHRANILNSDFTEIGVGYAQGGPYRNYWTQMFIRP